MNAIADHRVRPASFSSMPGLPRNDEDIFPPIVPVRPSLFVVCDMTNPIRVSALSNWIVVKITRVVLKEIHLVLNPPRHGGSPVSTRAYQTWPISSTPGIKRR